MTPEGGGAFYFTKSEVPREITASSLGGASRQKSTFGRATINQSRLQFQGWWSMAYRTALTSLNLASENMPGGRLGEGWLKSRYGVILRQVPSGRRDSETLLK